MKKSHLLGAVCAGIFTFTSITTVQAAPVSGQGIWETTLQSRLGGLAYYDTVLDITWLADADINGEMSWVDANAWAASLNINGVRGWRLPTVSPIDGSTFDNNWSNNATTDWGLAPTTTDGTDGGWRDGSGNPVNEMGHMYYVTLGNLGFCTPDNSEPSTTCIEQTGWGLSNTGPFTNIQSGFPPSLLNATRYWSGTDYNSDFPWNFDFTSGNNDDNVTKNFSLFAWAVHSGDVVPIPAAVWLFGSGLLGLIGIARRKAA